MQDRIHKWQKSVKFRFKHTLHTHIPPIHNTFHYVFSLWFLLLIFLFLLLLPFQPEMQYCHQFDYSFVILSFLALSLSAFNDWKEKRRWNFINVTWDIKMYFNARLCSFPLSLCVCLSLSVLFPSSNMSEPRKEFVGRLFYAKVSVCVYMLSVLDTQNDIRRSGGGGARVHNLIGFHFEFLFSIPNAITVYFVFAFLSFFFLCVCFVLHIPYSVQCSKTTHRSHR